METQNREPSELEQQKQYKALAELSIVEDRINMKALTLQLENAQNRIAELETENGRLTEELAKYQGNQKGPNGKTGEREQKQPSR